MNKKEILNKELRLLLGKNPSEIMKEVIINEHEKKLKKEVGQFTNL